MRLLLVGVLGCVACGSTPRSDPPANTTPAPAAAAGRGVASKDELARRTLDGIKRRSADSLLAMMSDLDTIASLCPENIARDGKDATAARIAESARGLGGAIDECWALADLSAAEVVGTSELASRTIDHCTDRPLLGATAIDVRAGDKRIAVSVKWLAASSGQIYVDDAPVCELAPAEGP